jgi:hypothetical protein
VGRVWVATHPDPLPVQPPARGADVLSLKREGTMYAVAGQSSRLDDALELAAPLNEGPPAPAVSGAWAAIESLLHHPGDKADPDAGRAVAADRLAALVACSWPRAELTALSYRHRPAQPDALSQALERAQGNAERCALVADALAGGAALALPSASDVAACQRMVRLLADPRKELGDVRVVFAAGLRRLYRQRNIIAHGGTTAAVALDAALRTAAPLIGSDRRRSVTDHGPQVPLSVACGSTTRSMHARGPCRRGVAVHRQSRRCRGCRVRRRRREARDAMASATSCWVSDRLRRTSARRKARISSSR